jgi:hypothetical protein
MNRVFLLSPANCNGLRARWVLNKNSQSALAQRLRADGAPLGEVFSFLSALYFRGKLAYALTFAAPPAGCPGVWLITPTAGLVAHDTIIRSSSLRGYSRGRVHLKNRSYCAALRSSARRLAGKTGHCDVVLLGSLATGKYLDILRPIFGQRLRIPEEFIGLGDMSRGGLLLRCVREAKELRYMEAAALSGLAAKQRAAKQHAVEGEPAGPQAAPSSLL